MNELSIQRLKQWRIHKTRGSSDLDSNSKISSVFQSGATTLLEERWASTPLQIAPLSRTLLSSIALMAAFCVVIFATTASYSRHVTVAGQLIPSGGVAKVYSSQRGVITERRIREGESVKAGDVLYVVSGDRMNAAHEKTQQTLSGTAQRRVALLRAQLDSLDDLEDADKRTIQSNIVKLEEELVSLRATNALQQHRLALSSDLSNRYETASKVGIISAESLLKMQDNALAIQVSTEEVNRSIANVGRELNEQNRALSKLRRDYESRASELNGQINQVEQEISINEMARGEIITAPYAGTASNVSGEVGQPTDTNKPLMAIFRPNDKLVADFFVPSRVIAFVRTGSAIKLKYDAYPYRKFGTYSGTVLTISGTALYESELRDFSANVSSIANAGGTSAPFYRVTVLLDSQNVRVYGLPKPLIAGMNVSGDFSTETRKVYEWLFD